MKNPLDFTTRIINAAINILFIGYPLQTAYGVAVGLALHAASEFFAPWLSQYASIIDPTSIEVWQYSIIGVVIIHLRKIGYIVSRATLQDENVEKAFDMLREAKANGVPEWRIQQMYLELCEKVLANVELKQTTKEEIRALLQEEEPTEEQNTDR